MTARGKRRPRLIAVGAALALIGSVVLFATSAAAAEEDVTSNHDADWHMRHTACNGTATGSQQFMPGPVGVPGQDGDTETPGDSPTGGPPAGTGSLQFTLGDNGGALEENRNTRYSGRPLFDLTELTYWTYVQSVPVPSVDARPAVYLGLSVDTDQDSVADDTLVFEPGYQQSNDGAGDTQHEVTAGTWQKWIAKDVQTDGNEGRWYRLSEPSTFRSIEGWVGQIPGLKLVNPTSLPGVDDPERNGSLFLAAGCGIGTWDDFVGYTDDVSVTFNSPLSTLEYDFNPATSGSASRLDCTPEDDLNPVGKAHTITCTATNSEDQRLPGVHVDAEAIGVNDANGDTPSNPDFACTTRSDDPTTPTTNEAGTCSFTHGPAGTASRGVTTYIAWIDEDDDNTTTEADRNEGADSGADPGPRPEPDDTDVVEKQWAPLLDCNPESATPQINTPHTITCTVREGTGIAVPDANVDLEMSGPNDTDSPTNNSYATPDLTCTTTSTGSCSVVHGPGGTGSTSSTGRTTYRAWIDLDNNNNTFEIDLSEGRTETTAPGSVPESDYTDVIEANWSTTGTSPSPTISPTSSPSGCPTASPSPGGSPSPSPSGSPCPTPSPTPTRTTSPSPSPSPTTIPPSPPCGTREESNMISGTPGDDILIGTPGDDAICGFGGNDTIRGRGGDDLLLGGRGDDSLKGGRGNDVVKGGAGNDALVGGAGKDRLRGGPGNDVLEGKRGRDRLGGGKGRDHLDGGRGRDRCDGGRGRNRLRRCE